MTQTRTFLLFAWLMVAVLLWMEWNKEQQPAAAQTLAASVPTTANVPAVTVPGATVATSAMSAAVAASAPTVSLNNDVLALQLDGRSITAAQLLKYPQTRA
ncbi:MAG TPA: hypothetical protein PLT77_16930, partial [Burkholderiaceae bacterium]|nr:hypothetical protein [Burkholderiaceae bacterium]